MFLYNENMMSLFEKRGECNIANFQNTPISEINIINKELVHSTSKRDEFCFNSRLWKESLNSDGQQFHHYQQNGQSTVTSSHWTKN